MIEMSRRSFLQSCLALAAAPAIVRASSLMPSRRAIGGALVFPGTEVGWHITESGIWIGTANMDEAVYCVTADGVLHMRGSLGKLISTQPIYTLAQSLKA